MKVENSKNPFYISYLFELIVEIWRFYFILFFQIWVNWGHSFHKILCMCRKYEKCKNAPQKILLNYTSNCCICFINQT